MKPKKQQIKKETCVFCGCDLPYPVLVYHANGQAWCRRHYASEAARRIAASRGYQPPP